MAPQDALIGPRVARPLPRRPPAAVVRRCCACLEDVQGAGPLGPLKRKPVFTRRPRRLAVHARPEAGGNAKASRVSLEAAAGLPGICRLDPRGRASPVARMTE